MCIHASWMNSDQCTRCNLPKTGFKVEHVGVERSSRVKRQSTIPARFMPRSATSPPLPIHRCVGCHKEVNPGFCYRGSVLSDLIHSTLITSSTTPVLGVVRVEAFGVGRDVVIGGHTIQGKRQIAFRKRTKGLICDGCASNTTRVSDGKGNTVPIVETQAVGGYLGETARGAETDLRHFRRGPAFNTRVTQGRRGKRV